MDKLKTKISQYGRWAPINDYILRVETHLETDFSISLENAKALLESIGKEICDAKGCPLADDSSVNGVLKTHSVLWDIPKMIWFLKFRLL